MHPDALSLAIGDGGNAVGMGRAVLADEIAELSPGGEFAPLLVNGCYRNRVQLGWDRVRGRSAAACVLCPQEALDYRQQPQRPGQQGTGQQAQGEEAQGGQVEEAVLAAIMAQPFNGARAHLRSRSSCRHVEVAYGGDARHRRLR